MCKSMKTFSLKAGDIQRKYYEIDGAGLVVGRVASVLAKILRGKNKPCYTPHLDHGDRVIVVNAEKMCFTGDKDKPLYRHTGHPGGIKHTVPSKVLQGPYAHRVLCKAVERMMGKNGPLRRDRMRNLFVYAGPVHPHAAQKPERLDVGAWNQKNRKKEA